MWRYTSRYPKGSRETDKAQVHELTLEILVPATGIVPVLAVRATSSRKGCHRFCC
jgi:hypothetical protein